MDSDQIMAFANFLEWGAIGFAGLMLVLVVFAIALKDLTPQLKGLLQTFMIIGGLCFLAALGGELYHSSISNTGRHRVVLSVLPNDLDGSDFPPPVILKDGARIDRASELFVSETTVLSIDVSGAVGLFRAVEERADTAQREVQQAQVTLAAVEQDAESAKQRVEQSEALVRALREETAAKNVALEEVEAEIRKREEELQEVASRNDALARQVQTLSADPSRSSSQSIRQIQRELLDINRSIQRVLP